MRQRHHDRALVGPAQTVRHHYDVHVWIRLERPGDGPAGPVVEHALEQPGVLPPGNDHADLDVSRLQLVHVAADGSGDVPVEALVDVQRDPQSRPDVRPSIGQAGGGQWVDACM